jgi:hypothetical protein
MAKPFKTLREKMSVDAQKKANAKVEDLIATLAGEDLIIMNTSPTFVMERRGKIEDLDRSFDLQFWQAQSDTARFAAAWELVVMAYRVQGKDVRQLRLQRSVESFQRQSR